MPFGRTLFATITSLFVASCSFTSDLDGLKATAGAAGTAGTEAGADAGPACEPGNCSGCVGCEAFCSCATTTAAAKAQCLNTACTTDAGSNDAASTGGAGGTGGSGGAGASGAGGSSGSGGLSDECQSCTLSSCGAEGNACVTDGECNKIVGCFGNCPDSACRNACDDNSPGAAAQLFQTLLACMTANCGSVCNF